MEEIDIWPAALAVGRALPVLPLALNAELCLPLDLDAAYTAACRGPAPAASAAPFLHLRVPRHAVTLKPVSVSTILAGFKLDEGRFNEFFHCVAARERSFLASCWSARISPFGTPAIILPMLGVPTRAGPIHRVRPCDLWPEIIQPWTAVVYVFGGFLLPLLPFYYNWAWPKLRLFYSAIPSVPCWRFPAICIAVEHCSALL